MMNPLNRFKTIQSLVEVGKLESADRLAEELLVNLPSDPYSSATRFNLGAMYWTEFGHGIKARSLFLSAVESLKGHRNSPGSNELLAHCCENLMLHSLSFEEYDDWAKVLSETRPQEEILAQQYPRIMRLRTAGQPWHRAAKTIADSYYRVEETHVTGKPGCAASVMHLILEHHAELSLPRDVWMATLAQFVALRLLVTAAACRAAVGAGQPETSAEILSLKRETLHYLEGFECRYPGDLRISQLQKQIQESIDRFLGEVPVQPSLPRVESSGPKSYPPHWQKSPELVQAVKSLGLNDIRLRLTEVSVLRHERQTTTFAWRRSLHLVFQWIPVSPPIPDERIHDVGLALRCIVGLTLPLAASRHGQLKVQILHDLEYRVRLGSGVPLNIFNLFKGEDRAVGLEMRSDESEGEFHVFATPGEISSELIVPPELTAMRARLMTMLASEFDVYHEVPVQLGH